MGPFNFKITRVDCTFFHTVKFSGHKHRYFKELPYLKVKIRIFLHLLNILPILCFSISHIQNKGNSGSMNFQITRLCAVSSGFQQEAGGVIKPHSVQPIKIH